MKTISIPKDMAKEELLLLTRREYDQLLDTIRKIEKKQNYILTYKKRFEKLKKENLQGRLLLLKN